VSFALLLGCGGALAEGKSEFEKGRYAEAKQTFLAAEQDSKAWDDTRRAEYALFRGLTHAALGDRAAAAVWLREAKALEDARPGALSTEDLERLKLGLAEVDAAAP
jgi:hypothetical protein